MTVKFTDALLAWYAQNARDLPWRSQSDPYAVWISEIMLQQTRVEAVIPYYIRWMSQFPTLSSLAQASQQDVLATWEGLGYYSRARNLHQAAQELVLSPHHGQFPDRVEALRKLPGIGRYTAGAIASIAFGKDEPALDGNIRRVLSRVFNLAIPARSPEGERRLWDLASANLPPGRAGDYNQALMELGALVCIPRQPNCPDCPITAFCEAHALGVQGERPVLEHKPPVLHYVVTAAIIEDRDHVLITQRPAKGLLGGLWEFPGGKLLPDEDLPACLQREIEEEIAVQINIGEAFGVYKHAYTHFRVTLHAFRCVLSNGAQPLPVQVQDLRWVKYHELEDYPMGKIDRQIARRLVKQDITQ